MIGIGTVHAAPTETLPRPYQDEKCQKRDEKGRKKEDEKAFQKDSFAENLLEKKSDLLNLFCDSLISFSPKKRLMNFLLYFKINLFILSELRISVPIP